MSRYNCMTSVCVYCGCAVVVLCAGMVKLVRQGHHNYIHVALVPAQHEQVNWLNSSYFTHVEIILYICELIHSYSTSII